MQSCQRNLFQFAGIYRKSLIISRIISMLSAFLAKACCNALQLADLDTSPLREHNGRVVRLRAAGSSICLRIGADGGFTPLHAAVDADATIEMPTPLLTGESKPIYASGDSELLAACQQVFEQARPDPEAMAERMFGSQGSALAASIFVEGGRLGQDSRQRLTSSLRSWLIDEAALVPDPQEVRQHQVQVEEFARRVEKLRRQCATRGSK